MRTAALSLRSAFGATGLDEHVGMAAMRACAAVPVAAGLCTGCIAVRVQGPVGQAGAHRRACSAAADSGRHGVQRLRRLEGQRHVPRGERGREGRDPAAHARMHACTCTRMLPLWDRCHHRMCTCALGRVQGQEFVVSQHLSPVSPIANAPPGMSASVAVNAFTIDYRPDGSVAQFYSVSQWMPASHRMPYEHMHACPHAS